MSFECKWGVILLAGNLEGFLRFAWLGDRELFYEADLARKWEPWLSYTSNNKYYRL